MSIFPPLIQSQREKELGLTISPKPSIFSAHSLKGQ